ncbi:hypothetical protein JOF29_005463 [Kribbella aluminosa]|uniref:Secreted protein n=1 Tax=Kribbella aluminosa TaxID=416017 RepID=A0ABS4URV0_9ACTN|nr:hypothetical protein [Kribbella aluminosa]MBP2354353.1 hypothetical protein [Kribbella aluminosa]
MPYPVLRFVPCPVLRFVPYPVLYFLPCSVPCSGAVLRAVVRAVRRAVIRASTLYAWRSGRSWGARCTGDGAGERDVRSTIVVAHMIAADFASGSRTGGPVGG